MSFGENLQKLRKQKGWSQEELAEKLELTRQTVSKWELEQSTPDLDYIIALSDLFQVSTDYLIKGEHTAEKQEAIPAENMKKPVITEEARLVTIWVIMGSVLVLLGLGGVIGFMGLAASSPPAYAEINGYHFEGFLGYLLCHHAVPYFAICVLLLLAGAALYALALIKYYNQKRKNAAAQ